MRWTPAKAVKTLLHVTSRPQRTEWQEVRFKGGHYPEFVSMHMYSKCCNAYVHMRDDFQMDGQWILCSACRDVIAFVRAKDEERMRKGYNPDDLLGPMAAIAKEAMDRFAEACREAAKHMPKVVRLFSEDENRFYVDNPPKVFIDDGEGVPREIGNINRITLNYGPHPDLYWQDDDPIKGSNTGEPRGLLDGTQETPQSDED